MKKRGIWVELTTLIIPGLNDSEDELKSIAGFIAGVGVEIPWHISRFHPDYICTDIKPTQEETLYRAQQIGKDAGLRYIYIGNIAKESPTLCYKCGKEFIKRSYPVVSKALLNANLCAECGTPLDGVF